MVDVLQADGGRHALRVPRLVSREEHPVVGLPFDEDVDGEGGEESVEAQEGADGQNDAGRDAADGDGKE